MISPAFQTAAWGAILESSAQDAARARDGLVGLCRTYWQPLYSYVRMRGYSPEDAQELTHRFFARLSQTDLSRDMAGARKRLRSFFLGALNRFLDLEQPALPRVLPAPAASEAEKLFEQNWALALLNIVYDRLRFEYETADKGEIFEALKFCLTSRGAAEPGPESARKLGVTDATLKILTERLRQRFLEILREEAAHSVASPDELEGELKYLSGALSS
ncbi:MAG TPA: hypothetical protein VHB20_03400 [Verrucomicrobiae bacterium]|jgi:RNA polymerase sigma-70 factor (ECF subfamily)|nr:hypothetical protein [Verrucomicrobiae bacterium]